MAGGTRSHSPPLPPNATYNHPVIALNILPSAKLYVAGSKLTGMLEISCKEKNSVALGQLAIEFFGIEELKLLDHSAQSSIHGPHKCIFQGPALPPSNAVVTSEAPIGGHYYTALRGRTKFPFSFPLPSKLPSSTDFDGKARVSYALKATCQVLAIQSRQNVLVTMSKAIHIVEKMLDWSDTKYHEVVEMRGELREASGSGAGVWAEVKIDKMLHYNQNSSMPDDGLIRAQLAVKNNSRRTLSGGVNAKICRKLVLPNDPPSLNDPTRIQVVRNCTFRGIDYEFPTSSAQAKIVKLICQLPSSSPDVTEHADKNVSCISARGMKLFSIDMFLRVELELGALSNDLVVDLPIYVTHSSSLPKELLIRNAPMTIDHVPSNVLSTSRLTEPQSSGRISHNPSRSSSPHPPSLQPGNISRSASPRLSLNTGGDWGRGASCPPSPVPSARFSPMPSPRHSPLPSARFSSPLPFSQSAVIPNNHFLVSRALPESVFGPPLVSWPNAQPASYPHDNHHSTRAYGFSTHPQQSTQGTPSNYQYPLESQPVFSPPTTPWSRQTSSAPSDPTVTYEPSMSQAGCAYQTTTQSNDPELPLRPQNQSHPHLGQQDSFSSSACQGSGMGSPMESPWRMRHQSLPTAPAPPPHHLLNPEDHYHGENDVKNPSASSQKPLNSRRISEPITTQPVQSSFHPQPNSGSLMVRKRALPTPPQMHEVAESPSTVHHYQNSVSTTQDHQQSTAPLPSNPIHSVQHARLETIGEMGESRPGTLNMKQTARDILSLNSLATSDESGEDGNRPPQQSKPARVVSQPRGMRPRQSDGSDSVKALEDIASKEDERLSSEGSHALESTCNQTPTPCQQPVYDDLSHSDPCNDNGSDQMSSCSDRKPQHKPNGPVSQFPQGASDLDCDHSSPAPHRHSISQPTPLTGLANLVHFLKRATSTEPPRALSVPEQMSPSRNLSLEDCEANTSHLGGDKLAATVTPSYIGSALRIKSTSISYGEIDAVPSPSHRAHKSSLSSDGGSTSSPNKANWKPPSSLANPSIQASRTSITEQINMCDDQVLEEIHVGRESIAPEALFPQFQPEQPLVNGQGNSDPQSILASQTPPSSKSLSGSTFPNQPPNNSAPLLIPSGCPLVKKKGSRTSRRTSQSQKQNLDQEACSSPSLDHSKSASSSRNPLSGIKTNTPLLQTTIVERLRSQNGRVIDKSTQLHQLEPSKDSSTFSSLPVNHSKQQIEKKQRMIDLVCEGENKVNDTQNVVTQLPSNLPQSYFKPTPMHNNQSQIIPVSTQSDQACITAPSALRLSAIPRSPNPLSLGGSSCSTSSSHSIPHRPLPISPVGNHNPTSLNFEPVTDPSEGSRQPAEVAMAYDAKLPTRALFSSKPVHILPKQVAQEHIPSNQLDRGGSHFKTNSLGDPCSPTSPTNLARKSRIKRQVSLTNTSHEYPNGSRMGTERGVCDRVITINRVPGGWNEEESNEIEAQLMEALKETNLAVQKATSRRLSTPQFSKSPTLNRNLVFSNLQGSSQAEGSSIRCSRINRDQYRASMSIVEGPGERSGSREIFDQQGNNQDSCGSHTDESHQGSGCDEDTPIRLTSGEYKSMRGGRGGRVSSVVGQWAKLSPADDGPGMLSAQKGSDGLLGGKDKNSSAETITASSSKLLASTRGVSIRPRKLEHTPSYSITGFLSRNSSLASHSSKPAPPSTLTPEANEEKGMCTPGLYLKKTLTDKTKLRSGESRYETPDLQTPRKTFPLIPKSTVVGEPDDQKKESTVAAVGYRNLANRLSGVIPINTPKSTCSSSSTSSISSLASSLNHLGSSDNDLPTVKKSNKSNRAGIIGGADRQRHHSVHAGFPGGGAISDLVKKWET